MAENKKEKEVAAAGMEPVKSRREKFREGFSSRHPDVDINDEEAYYGALDDEYNQREEEIGKYRSDNEKLNNMFMENPHAAYFMNDLIDGKEQLGVALMRQFGDTFRDAVDDPTEENVKAFADALDEHAAKIKENDALQAEFEQNADASEATIEAWAKEHNANGEQIDAMREFINNQFASLLSGVITKELLDFAYKGLNYDNDVAAAAESGAAQGRNEKIRETMRRGKGDGMPVIQGGSKQSPAKKTDFLQGVGRTDPWKSARREKY